MPLFLAGYFVVRLLRVFTAGVSFVAFLVAFAGAFLSEISVLSDFGLNLISVGYLADIRSQT